MMMDRMTKMGGNAVNASFLSNLHLNLQEQAGGELIGMATHILTSFLPLVFPWIHALPPVLPYLN